MSFTSVSDTITKVAILDLNTGTVTGPSDVNTHHQMFCTGLALLADGRLTTFFAGLAGLCAAGFFALREAVFFFDFAIKIKSRVEVTARRERLIKNKSPLAQAEIYPLVKPFSLRNLRWNSVSKRNAKTNGTTRK